MCLVLGVVASCGSGRQEPLRGAARAALHDSELSHAIPILSVSDLRASERYYRDVLGFKLDWEDGDPPDFASVSRGDAVLFMCQRCQGRAGNWLMIFSRDVDRLYQEFRSKGALVPRAPRDERWRLREMHVSDPDGHVIRFASATKH